MTDFDMLFSRLRGVTWSHVAMAAGCFALATALFVSPAWVFADFARLQQMLSLFGVAAGALSAIGAVASTTPMSWGALELVLGVGMLLAGLFTLYFPVAAFGFSTTVSVCGIFLALYLVATALEMDRRGCGRWGMQLAVALVVLVLAFAGLNGLAGASGMLALAAATLYVAAWGFVYAAVSLSKPAETLEVA
jgi:hypothetical protein